MLFVKNLWILLSARNAFPEFNGYYGVIFPGQMGPNSLIFGNKEGQKEEVSVFSQILLFLEVCTNHFDIEYLYFIYYTCSVKMKTVMTTPPILSFLVVTLQISIEFLTLLLECGRVDCACTSLTLNPSTYCNSELKTGFEH